MIEIRKIQWLRIIYRIIRNQFIKIGLASHGSGAKKNRFKRFRDKIKPEIDTLFDFNSFPDIIKSKSLLELGMGDGLEIGIYLLTHGISSYTGIDKYNQPVLDKDIIGLFQNTLPPEVQSSFNSNFTTIDDKIFSEKIKVIHDDIFNLDKIGLPKFDIIFSFFTLEHIIDIDKLFNICHSLLKDGGKMYHIVGLVSHDWNREKHPLEFLTYSDWLWNLMTSNTDAPNRLRFNDYKIYLKKNGFQINTVNVLESYDEKMIIKNKPKLNKRFRNYTVEDLKPSKVMFSATKI